MDRKLAMAILGLSGNASFQDARVAFRRLAKQHHPDHFARDAVAMLQAEKQMKVINQAYQLLASVLPRGGGNASCVQDMPGAKRSSGFADMFMRMKKRFWKQSSRCRPTGSADTSCRADAAGKAGMSDLSGKTNASGKTGVGAKRATESGRASASGREGSARNTPFSGATGYSRTHARAFTQKSRPADPRASFEQVITPLFAGAGSKPASGHGPDTGKRFAAKPYAPYAGFFRYMELKNRIQNRNRFQDWNNSTKIEKISRICPVGRVKRD